MLADVQAVVGRGEDGWVPTKEYTEAKQRERLVKAKVVEAAESDEDRARILEHWPFNDFDEEPYTK